MLATDTRSLELLAQVNDLKRGAMVLKFPRYRVWRHLRLERTWWRTGSHRNRHFPNQHQETSVIRKPEPANGQSHPLEFSFYSHTAHRFLGDGQSDIISTLDNWHFSRPHAMLPTIRLGPSIQCPSPTGFT
jgi:hypothetical protein